jgi:hypothetical protein
VKHVTCEIQSHENVPHVNLDHPHLFIYLFIFIREVQEDVLQQGTTQAYITNKHINTKCSYKNMMGLYTTMRGHKCQQLFFKRGLRCDAPEGVWQRAPQHRSAAAEVLGEQSRFRTHAYKSTVMTREGMLNLQPQH